MRKTTEIFTLEMQTINPDIEIIGEYINAKTKIEYKCLICGKINSNSPTHLLSGEGCPCQKYIKISNALKSSKIEFENRLHNEFPDIIVSDDFVNMHTPVTVSCRVCGYIWKMRPQSLLVGCGCQRCNNGTSSKGESRIIQFLDKHSIIYELHKRFDECVNEIGYKLSYDFYLPFYNLLIEFQGIQHYQPIEFFGGVEQFKKQKEHDKIKKLYASQNGFNLLCIKFDDINNIENILSQILIDNSIPVTTTLV